MKCPVRGCGFESRALRLRGAHLFGEPTTEKNAAAYQLVGLAAFFLCSLRSGAGCTARGESDDELRSPVQLAVNLNRAAMRLYDRLADAQP